MCYYSFHKVTAVTNYQQATMPLRRITMKYLAIALTVALGLSATAVSASTGSDQPILTLAMSNNAPQQWIDFPTYVKDHSAAEHFEREQLEKMEQLNIDLDKALEEKFSREFSGGN